MQLIARDLQYGRIPPGGHSIAIVGTLGFTDDTVEIAAEGLSSIGIDVQDAFDGVIVSEYQISVESPWRPTQVTDARSPSFFSSKITRNDFFFFLFSGAVYRFRLRMASYKSGLARVSMQGTTASFAQPVINPFPHKLFNVNATLGTTDAKFLFMKTGNIINPSSTSEQTILEHVVAKDRTFYLQNLRISGRHLEGETGFAGTASFETDMKLVTEDIFPGAPIDQGYAEPLFFNPKTSIRVTVVPQPATVWRASFVGYEKVEGGGR